MDDGSSVPAALGTDQRQSGGARLEPEVVPFDELRDRERGRTANVLSGVWHVYRVQGMTGAGGWLRIIEACPLITPPSG